MRSLSFSCLVVLSLFLACVGMSRAQSASSTSNPTQPSDEETLRAMNEQYASAITSSDLEKMRLFWNPQSKNLAPRLRLYRELFFESRIEFIDIKVTRLEITSDRAISHLTTDERRLDKKTGAPTLTYDPLHGACRALEWIKTGGVW